jgi:hypothetical protein
MSDLYTLAQQLGVKNLTNNAFSSNPLTQKYITERGRAEDAEQQLQSTTTPVGAISSGIALYMQRKQENKALEELNQQMQVEQQAKASRRESLINALPEANRVIGDALTNDEDLAKYAMQTLTPSSEEDKLTLENKRLQNQKLRKDINQVGRFSSGGSNGEKAPAGYRFTQAGDLEAIAGGPATKQSAEAAGKIALIKQGLSDVEAFENQIKNKNGSFNRAKIAGLRVYGRPNARDEYSKLNNSLNARLRLESGAAVPEQEVERAFETFAPNPLDSDATIKSKLARMKEFFSGAQTEIGQGRGANPVKTELSNNNVFQASNGVKYTIKR